MKFSPEQIEAINHLHGPALIIAVPGAGKTTVLVHRTYNLIARHNISSERILSITFSRASALDMKSRFLDEFKLEAGAKIHFSTIHSFCYGLIREYAYINRINYKFIEGNNNKYNKYNLLRQIYHNINRDYLNEDKLDNLINAIGYVKNMMISPDNFPKNDKFNIDNFKSIFLQYENYKKRYNLLDFDDLLTISLEILTKNRYLLEKYRNKYDFIQLDEGQDTSKIQLEIIKLISYPENNLIIVADDDQSIYGFRGADPKGLLNFEKTYADGKIFYMEKNYRSSKNIVTTCNKFIQSNSNRYEKNIITDNGHIKPINIVKLNKPKEQYEYIIDDLKDKDLSQSCILYRNNLSAIGIATFLEKYDISFYSRDKRLRFFNHWMIKDIINIMSFAEDTSNMSLYEKFYYKIKGYISKRQINYAKKLNSRLPVFDRIMDFPGISRYYMKNLKELKADFAKIKTLKPKKAIDYIAYDLGYDEYLRENSIKFGHTYSNLNTMLLFLKLIADDAENISDFRYNLNHMEDLCRDSLSNKDTITLSTIHSAKGLEFENVYIIDLVDGEFPNSSSIEAFNKGDLEALEEERRLFYVGMSRAKTNLHLISLKYINSKSLKLSRFLSEIKKNS